jgi:hypothetical protein
LAGTPSKDEIDVAAEDALRAIRFHDALDGDAPTEQELNQPDAFDVLGGERLGRLLRQEPEPAPLAQPPQRLSRPLCQVVQREVPAHR